MADVVSTVNVGLLHTDFLLQPATDHINDMTVMLL